MLIYLTLEVWYNTSLLWQVLFIYIFLRALEFSRYRLVVTMHYSICTKLSILVSLKFLFH